MLKNKKPRSKPKKKPVTIPDTRGVSLIVGDPVLILLYSGEIVVRGIRFVCPDNLFPFLERALLGHVKELTWGGEPKYVECVIQYGVQTIITSYNKNDGWTDPVYRLPRQI